jgi:exopolysaccharide biosynthesis polyprenyl glycosylphosphotransferase
VFSRHHRKARLLFGLSDIVLIVLAFEAAYQTRLLLPIEKTFYLTVPMKALLLGVSLAAWISASYWFEVYERLDSASIRVILRDTLRQCLFGSVSLVLLEFLLRLDLSRSFLLLFGFYSFITLAVFRCRAGYLVGAIRREFGALHFVMITGVGDSAIRIGQVLERSQKYGVRLLGFINESNSPAPDVVQLSQEYPVYPLSSLPQLLEGHVIDEIIFAVESRKLPELEEVLLQCDEEGVRTHVVVDFFPHVNSAISLESIGPATLLTFAAAPNDELRLFVKRSIDVALAGIFLLLLLPLMATIALLIKLTSPGPAIFRQVRCGLNGRRFICYKFRSMCEDAEQLKAQLEHLNEKQTAFKIPNDPRLTAIGRYMRKFSVDEWPQLWNVIKGEMSLVGPRPAVPEEVQRYQRWQRRRLRMRPGLTCLWAISGRDRLDFETWMRLDMQYIDRWSLALDWKIILRTIPQVLLGRGAH